ncbi:maltose O-acetyltransferase [Oxalicibacterium flavum]|uniref:Nodulation protein L n=1 Tax=Oxalicibacterium flavum TaxID=179467 RepID=A0A8J2UNG2_9BURK|nr:sugar O-acetyltransferase [Oxalicibacterium flavum]GGC13093.1 maltose O-acetyltransferase [Oxalicibacterium flavum]
MSQDDNNARTQLEKMQAGELYTADDEELAAEQRRAYLLMREFEAQYAVSIEAGNQVLEKLLGSIGNNVNIRPPLYIDYGRFLHVGDDTFVNYGLVALDVAPITIGRNVKIGTNVQLLTPTHPVEPELRWKRLEAAKPIVIGDNVWIGSGAIVLAGVTVGENSVIGAGAVVTKDVPANVVVVGNPAKVVRNID